MSAPPTPWARFSGWVGRSVFSWATLRELGHNSVVKTAPLWAAGVPFLMRVVEWLSHVLQLNHPLNLPFNFLMFYLAAVCFSLGMGVFIARCPKLIKNAQNHGEFITRNHSEVELREWTSEFFPRSKVDRHERDPDLVLQYLSLARGFDNLTQAEMAAKLSGKAGPTIMDRFWDTPAGARLPSVFNFALGLANAFRPLSRAAVTLAFVIGFVFVGATVLYNFSSAYHYFHDQVSFGR